MNRLLKCSNATPGLGYLPSSNTWAKRRETSDFADVSDLINKLLKCSKHNCEVGMERLWLHSGTSLL